MMGWTTSTVCSEAPRNFYSLITINTNVWYVNSFRIFFSLGETLHFVIAEMLVLQVCLGKRDEFYYFKSLTPPAFGQMKVLRQNTDSNTT